MRLQIEFERDRSYFQKVYYEYLKNILKILRIISWTMVLFTGISGIWMLKSGSFIAIDLENFVGSVINVILWEKMPLILGYAQEFVFKRRNRNGKVKYEFDEKSLKITYINSNEKMEIKKENISSLRKKNRIYVISFHHKRLFISQDVMTDEEEKNY